MSINIEGFEGIDRIFKNLENKISSNEREVLGKACAMIERDAKILAPKDTGALRRSIASRIEEEDGELTGIVFTPLEYAPYPEFGTGLFAEGGNGRKTPWAYEDEKTGEVIWTSGQHPQPYMRPALENNREQIIQMAKEDLLK